MLFSAALKNATSSIDYRKKKLEAHCITKILSWNSINISEHVVINFKA